MRMREVAAATQLSIVHVSKVGLEPDGWSLADTKSKPRSSARRAQAAGSAPAAAEVETSIPKRRAATEVGHQTLDWDLMQRSRNGRLSQTRYGEAERTTRARQRAVCIAALPEDSDLHELEELLRTAGVAVVGKLVQRREHPHPNSYLGPGKLEELKELIKRSDANLVACDDELSPRQERNL